MMDWLYILPAPILFFGILLIYCYFWEKQGIYLRVDCDNPIDIEYFDYIFNYAFFDKLNKQLESHLILYVKEHFYSLGIPYENVKVTASVSYEKIAIASYLEMTRKQQLKVREESLSCVNIAQEVQQFYRFIDNLRQPNYEQIVKVRKLK